MSGISAAEAEVKNFASMDTTGRSTVPQESEPTSTVSKKIFAEAEDAPCTTLADLVSRREVFAREILLLTSISKDPLEIILDYTTDGNPERIKFFIDRKLSPRISLPQTMRPCRFNIPENEFLPITAKMKRAGIEMYMYPSSVGQQVVLNRQVIAQDDCPPWLAEAYEGPARAATAALGYLRKSPEYFRYALCESIEDYGDVIRNLYSMMYDSSAVETSVTAELQKNAAFYQKFITTLACGRRDFTFVGKSNKDGKVRTYALSVYGFPLHKTDTPGRGATLSESRSDAWEKAYEHVTQKIRELTFNEFVILENEAATWPRRQQRCDLHPGGTCPADQR